jgi:hypothetical protein
MISAENAFEAKPQNDHTVAIFLVWVDAVKKPAHRKLGLF